MTRRLYTMALMVLGLSMLLSSTGCHEPTSRDPRVLRVGVIGTGCIGIEHLNNLHLCDSDRGESLL